MDPEVLSDGAAQTPRLRSSTETPIPCLARPPIGYSIQRRAGGLIGFAYGIAP